MTAPETRWTAETEEVLAEEFDQFVGHRFLIEDRDRVADLALAHLSGAGLLLPPGGETREELGVRALDSPVVRVTTWGGAVANTTRYCRTVTAWPVEGEPNDNWPRYTGPWIEVPS